MGRVQEQVRDLSAMNRGASGADAPRRGSKPRRSGIALFAVALAIATVAGGTVLLERRRESEYRAEAHERARFLGGILARGAEEVLRFGVSLRDVEELQQRCQDLERRAGFISFVMVVDAGGVVLHHSDPNREGTRVGPEVLPLPAAHPGAVQGPATVDGAPVHRIAIPISGPRDELAGAVVLGVPADIKPPSGRRDFRAETLGLKAVTLAGIVEADVRKVLALGLDLAQFEDLGARLSGLADEHPEAAYLAVVDTGGRVIRHSDPRRRGESMDVELAGGQASLENATVGRVAVGDRSLVQAAIPLRGSGGRHVGFVLAGMGGGGKGSR